MPAAGAVTSTVTVQEPPAESVPPEREMLPLPAIAVNVPPQVVVALGGVATTMLPGKTGRVSVNVTFVSDIELELFRIKVIVDFALIIVEFGEKDFVMFGLARTVALAVAGALSDVFRVVSICVDPISA